MSTTREIPSQLVLDFDVPATPVAIGTVNIQSNVVQVVFGQRRSVVPPTKQEDEHQNIIRQVLQNAKMLSW